jgi:redox-sensitive bicupin YhaK (pirin superfamily)
MKHPIIHSGSIDFRLPVKPPFIFNAHHLDHYPEGNEKMEPIDYLDKRNNGDDFDPDAPWRMYHGTSVPGFPVHPHRGFETVTIVEQGFVDHSDSLGSTGRYGEGDVQWLTAGRGVQHCEMFPLVHQDRPNTLELFQVWLNLPSERKMVKPYYKMLWNEDIPVVKETDGEGNSTLIKVVAGDYSSTKALAPTPNSWAADEKNKVTIWLITMEPEATWTLRATSETAGRMLYLYRGEAISIDGENVENESYAELIPNQDITIKNGVKPARLLLLEGEPIPEKVAARGPFVMNTETEILEAIRDYQRTWFGGWPWERNDHVNPLTAGRFSQYSDGTVEYPKAKTD